MDFEICGNALRRLFRKMLVLAAKVDHRMVWVMTTVVHRDPLGDENSSKVFLLCTTDAAKARKIRETLEKAGLLCDTDLGPANINCRAGLTKHGIG